MSNAVEQSGYGMCGSGYYRDSGEFIYFLQSFNCFSWRFGEMFQLLQIIATISIRKPSRESIVFKSTLTSDILAIFCSMLRPLRFFFKDYVVFGEIDWGFMKYASRVVQIWVSVFFQCFAMLWPNKAKTLTFPFSLFFGWKKFYC